MQRIAIVLWLALASSCAFAVGRAEVIIVPTTKGLAVRGSEGLEFEIGYPVLFGKETSAPLHRVVEAVPNGSAAVVKYEGGARADLVVQPDGAVDIRFSNVPGDVEHYGCETCIDYRFADGGKWRLDDGPARSFPTGKPAHPQFYAGKATTFSIFADDGVGLAFTMTRTPTVELTDHRAGGRKTFGWRFFSPFDAENPSDHLKIDSAAPAPAAEPPASPPVQVDRFGQSVRGDWPDKVRSEDDLKSDAAAEAEYYAGFHPPVTDRFGGLPGSGAKLGLAKTGFFRVQKTGDAAGRWLLVDPDGNVFFHLGVGCFTTPSWTYVAGRRALYEWLPPLQGEFNTAFIGGNDPDDFSFYNANVIRKFGKPVDSTEVSLRMIDRVRRWGFNSAGPFTDAAPAFQRAGFPYVLGLPGGLPEIPGMERVVDPFADGAAEQLDANFAAEVAPRADDPLLIGYFFGNEPILEDIPRLVPTLDGQQGAKRRLVQMLREKYVSIERFNQAWDGHAADFAGLNDASLAVTTPAAVADMQEYTGLFLDRLFTLVETTFRKYDKHHLLLGYRLQYGTINSQQLCRLMSQHVDVVAFNYYTYGLDVDFLNKIHGWTDGKPMLLSEFYWSSPQDSGLSGGVKDVEGQEARGLAYRNYLEQAAALGYVVGVEWFTLIDQSVTGNWFSKYNGENGNTGLFAVSDRPWKKAVESMVKSNYAVYDIVLDHRPAFVYDDPLFQLTRGGNRTLKLGRATGPIRLDGSNTNWPGLPAEELGSRVVQGTSAGGVGASFKACYDDDNFYLVINVTDPSPMKNDHVGGGIWMGDAVELFFGHEQTGDAGSPLPSDRHLLLSAALVDGKPVYDFADLVAQPPCRLVVLPDSSGKGYTLETIIPFDSLGFKPVAGSTIRFDIGVDDSTDGRTRARQLMWNGTERNSRERSGWGRATFIQ